jgi:hypothetical protein
MEILPPIDENNETSFCINSELITKDDEDEDDIHVPLCEKYVNIENKKIIIYFRQFTSINNSTYMEQSREVMCELNTQNISQQYIHLIKKSKEEGHEIDIKYDDNGKILLSLYEISLWCMLTINLNYILRIYLDIINLNMFIPCHRSSWNIDKNNVISGCYYHDKKLHTDIFSADNTDNTDNIDNKLNNIIMMEEDFTLLYNTYNIDKMSQQTKRLRLEDVEDVEDVEDAEDIEDAEDVYTLSYN